MTSEYERPGQRGASRIFLFVLFAGSGICSACLFMFPRAGFFTWGLQGLLYTLFTTILFFKLGIRVNLFKLLTYIALMELLYAGVFLCTVYSGIFITGILFSGLGTLFSFLLAYWLIRPFPFNMAKAFICGAVSFLPADIVLMIRPLYQFILYFLNLYFDDELSHILILPGLPVFTWQVMSGFGLNRYLMRNEKETAREKN